MSLTGVTIKPHPGIESPSGSGYLQVRESDGAATINADGGARFSSTGEPCDCDCPDEGGAPGPNPNPDPEPPDNEPPRDPPVPGGWGCCGGGDNGQLYVVDGESKGPVLVQMEPYYYSTAQGCCRDSGGDDQEYESWNVSHIHSETLSLTEAGGQAGCRFIASGFNTHDQGVLYKPGGTGDPCPPPDDSTTSRLQYRVEGSVNALGVTTGGLFTIANQIGPSTMSVGVFWDGGAQEFFVGTTNPQFDFDGNPTDPSWGVTVRGGALIAGFVEFWGDFAHNFVSPAPPVCAVPLGIDDKFTGRLRLAWAVVSDMSACGGGGGALMAPPGMADGEYGGGRGGPDHVRGSAGVVF